MTSPCYDEVTRTDCPKRTADCAKDCPKWAEHVKKREEIYEARLKETRAYVRKVK